MKKFLNLLRYAPKRVSMVIAVVAAAVIVPAGLMAWGPDRPTFSEQSPADYVTFNSITDNSVYGDERLFANIRDASDPNSQWKRDINIEKGKQYMVRMYVHNNAAEELNLVAHNTRVGAALSPDTAKENFISTFISADNAQPQEVWDDVKLMADEEFNLAYVPNSAYFFNNGIGGGAEGVALPDDIATNKGALLGFDKLDGEMPGCYYYSGWVYFNVQPQFAEDTPDISIQKLVRKAGTNTDYKQSVTVKPGDKINYRIEVDNTGFTTQYDTVVKDSLPEGISFVPGTVDLFDADVPGGVRLTDGEKLVGDGLNIGGFEPGTNAMLVFDAQVTGDVKQLSCGMNTLVNKATVIPKEGESKSDTATVKVNRVCKDVPVTPELPKTGFDSGLMAAIGLGTLTGATIYFGASIRHRNLMNNQA